MKSKLFNVVVYGMLGYSMLNGVYFALPVELQEMIPQYNAMVAAVGGVSGALFGFGGLKVQEYLNRAKTQADEKFNLLAQNYLNLERKYDVMEKAYKLVEQAQNKTTLATERNNKLLEIDLQAKLSNPMIDEQVKALIEGVLKSE